ncbi:hypothetical protein BON30_47440 [Cystobacter ferrugineus]|uniref:Uncharacterized protein n=1 Tax=Cystobacter ferrugineus TaxID=83449 RepID=A0A1L9AUK2_9BACT|nr:hypothetical protein BON30_47440 [Cystobacter ferrugineus]
MILSQVRGGDFSRIDRLLGIYDETSSDLLRWSCVQIIGDAGTTSCFKRVAQELDDALDPDKAGKFCNAFEAWGSLSAVPALLQSYERYFGFQDIEGLPLKLSTLLEMEWGPLMERPTEDGLLVYEDRVMEWYEMLKQKFGTEKVILLHGERFGVVSLARRMLRCLGDSYFEKTMQPFYRRRFEASTGIDCSGFYKDRNFQPLTAAAILEGFLESPEAARYEEGVRYFFGHRIPE